MSRVLAVSSKQLIAAHPRKHHGRLLARLTAHQIRGDDRWIGGRLIHVPDQTRQQTDHIGFNHDLVVLAAQFLSQPPRYRRIVNGRLPNAVFLRKGDRVRAHRLLARHGCHDAR